MYRDPYYGKLNTRKFKKYYLTNKRTSQDPHDSSYSNMLIQDLHMGIMPIGGTSENPNFKVEINPPSKEVETLIANSLLTQSGRQWDLTESVCDFIDEAAHFLVYWGKVYYEIVYYYSVEKENQIEGFTIENIPNHCIRDNIGFCWQFESDEVCEERVGIFERLVWLPKKDLLFLSIPKTFGGVKKFKKLLSNLQWISKYTFPEFAMKDIAQQKQTKGYDFLTYRKNQNTILVKITKHLGWTARGTFDDETLEFYQIYKLLKFEKTKAILREYILRELNKTFKIIGKKMGFNAKIKIEGIPLSQDFDKYLSQLKDGVLPFSDAVKLMRV